MVIYFQINLSAFWKPQKDGAQKSEYFLLGMLASFTLAILVGLGVNYLLGIYSEVV